MKTGIIISVVAILTIAVIYLYSAKNRENLSLSQWMPSKEDCSSLIKPPPPVLPAYPDGTPVDCNLPKDKRLRLKNCSAYATFKPETSCAGCGGCSSCRSKKMLYPIDSCFKTTPTRENMTDIPLPPISEDLELVYETTVRKFSPDMLKRSLDNGDLVVSAKSKDVIEYLLYKLKYPGGNGYPDFYKIDGAVTVLTKDGKNYYYMIDYPIKYKPKNIRNYINTTPYTDYAVDAWRAGTRLLESCSPVLVFKNMKPSGKLMKKPPPVNEGECCKSVWGPPYGCGNWLLRV